jgi:hypothetical protein
VSDVEHSHQGTIDYEDDAVIAMEKLADLFSERIVLRCQRTALRKTAERLDGFLNSDEPAGRPSRRPICNPALGVVQVSHRWRLDQDAILHASG